MKREKQKPRIYLGIPIFTTWVKNSSLGSRKIEFITWVNQSSEYSLLGSDSTLGSEQMPKSRLSHSISTASNSERPENVEILDSPTKGKNQEEQSLAFSDDDCFIIDSRSPQSSFLLGHERLTPIKREFVKNEVKQEDGRDLGISIKRPAQSDSQISDRHAVHDLDESTEIEENGSKPDDDQSEEEDLFLVSSDESSEESFVQCPAPVKFRGNRRYINPVIFQKIRPVSMDAVPQEIDGTCVYVVPLDPNGKLQNCKGGRPCMASRCHNNWIK